MNVIVNFVVMLCVDFGECLVDLVVDVFIDEVELLFKLVLVDCCGNGVYVDLYLGLM